MHCKICDSATADFGQLRVLSSFDARYRRCTRCGFVSVASAEWLQQAYSSAIAASDTGIVARNLKLAEIVSLLIELEFPAARRFLDFGGGAGLLVRLMRDQGFDFYLLDKYCANVLAAGFEAKPGERFDLLTCMEVVEHLLDPLPAFMELGALAPSIVIGTELLPATANRPGEWWYYAPETGQHISFYTVAALQVIAERMQLHLATNGRNLHVLSQAPVSDRLLRFISSRRARSFARALVRLKGRKRRSLTESDAGKARCAR